MVATMKTILILLATIMTTTLSLPAADSLYNIPLKDIAGKILARFESKMKPDSACVRQSDCYDFVTFIRQVRRVFFF